MPLLSFWDDSRARLLALGERGRSVAAALMVWLAAGSAVCAAEAKEIKVALLADPHCTLSTEGPKAAYARRFAEAIEEINAAHVDLVLVAGDLADTSKPEQWQAFRTAIKGFQAPVLYVPGNHDVGPKPNTGKEGVTSSQRYAAYVKEMGPGFWVKEFSGLRVVGVTSSLFGTGLPEEADQWKFLGETLAAPSAVPTLVVTHYPLFVESPDEPGGGYWNIEPEPRARLLALFKGAHVRAVLSGHLHRPLLHRQDGLLFAGAPPISFGLPRGKQPEGWALITISQEGIQAQPVFLDLRT